MSKTLSEMNTESPNYTPNSNDFVFVETASGQPRAVQGGDLANMLLGHTVPESSIPAVGSVNVGLTADTPIGVGPIEWDYLKQQSETFFNFGGATKLNIPAGNISKVVVSLRIQFVTGRSTAYRVYITKNGDLVDGRVGYGEGLYGLTVTTSAIDVVPTDFFEVFVVEGIASTYKANECDFSLYVVERSGV